MITCMNFEVDEVMQNNLVIMREIIEREMGIKIRKMS